jgi:glycosyltransferase involved in cell wall biosynthesis
MNGLSIVVSAYNQLPTLKMVLESYRFQKVKPVSVVVADDGSSDGTQAWLDHVPDDYYPFRLSYTTRQHLWYRLASNNNTAAHYAISSRILFTNADQIHAPGSVGSHIEMPDDVVGVGIFLGIRFPESRTVTIETIREFPAVERLYESYRDHKRNDVWLTGEGPASRDPKKWALMDVDPRGVWGGNISVPTDLFWKVGGYDEGYDAGWGGEESDLAERIVKAGGKIRWVVGSVLYHLGHPIRNYAEMENRFGSRRYYIQRKINPGD